MKFFLFSTKSFLQIKSNKQVVAPAPNRTSKLTLAKHVPNCLLFMIKAACLTALYPLRFAKVSLVTINPPTPDT